MLSIVLPDGVISEEAIARPDPLLDSSSVLTGQRTVIGVGLDAFQDPGAAAVDDVQDGLQVSMGLGDECRRACRGMWSSMIVHAHMFWVSASVMLGCGVRF